MSSELCNINMLSLNCQGIKGNLGYINNMLLAKYDIMFVCEHWLRPCDMYTFNSMYRTQHIWSNLKSGMSVEHESNSGRPYGGVGFICKKQKRYHFRDVQNQDERISVI